MLIKKALSAQTQHDILVKPAGALKVGDLGHDGLARV